MLTYANQLTILRVIFIPCFVLLLIHEHPLAATLIFVFAGITDGLDGLIARRLQQKTPLGAFLDPMADKLLVAAAFVTLSVPAVPVTLHIPVWLTITSISRDLLIALVVLIIHLQTGHSRFPPSFLGKCTTTAQLLTVGFALLGNFTTRMSMAVLRPVVYSTLLLTVASGLHYFYRSVRMIESYRRLDARDGKEGNQNR